MLLNELFSAFDALCDKHGCTKVETIGDAYMVVAGNDGAQDHTVRMPWRRTCWRLRRACGCHA